MLKLVLITHDDLDAAGCRITFEIAYHHLKKGEDYIVVNCANSTVDQQVLETLAREDISDTTKFFFADITCSRGVLETMVKNGYEIRMFDHHRTNFWTTLVVNNAVIVEENELGIPQCGASLLYQYFCEGEYPYKDWRSDLSFTTPHKLMSVMIDSIRSSDTFEFKITNNMDAKKLNILFFMLGMERFCKKFVNKCLFYSDQNLFSGDELEFIDAKIENEQAIIDKFTLDDIYDTNVRGYRTAFLMKPTGANVSELAYQFLKANPQFDLFAYFSLFNGGEFSFRTQREDLDTGRVIAAPIGGGGHPKASGAPLDEVIKTAFFKILLDKMNGWQDIITVNKVPGSGDEPKEG